MACPAPKVTTRYVASDWFKNIQSTVQTAENERREAQQLREDGRWLANETEIRANWNQHDNNVRLAMRIDDINCWKEKLERTLNDLDRELAMLSMAKEQVEQAFQNKTLAQEINKFCMTIRDRRQNFEVVKDAVEQELIKEAKVVEGVRDQLNKKSRNAFEQLCILQEMRNNVDIDLHDKRVAMAIDCDVLHMDNRSPNKSFKPNPTRMQKNAVSLNRWLDYSNESLLGAETEIQNSRRLREDIYTTILHTDNDMNAQKEATEYEFRKRMHEVGQAIDELQWQKKNVEDEIVSMEKLIINLEDAWRGKLNAIKLAQTRLENRTNRPNMELCQDNVHGGLSDEAKQLQETREAIEELINNSRGKLSALQSTIHIVSNNLRDKMVAQQLDQQCMEERQKLTVGGRKAEDTDRTLKLIGIQKALPETNWIAASTNPSITTGHWNVTNPNLNLMRSAWELGRTDPNLIAAQMGPSDHFGKSGLYANASFEKPKSYS